MDCSEGNKGEEKMVLKLGNVKKACAHIRTGRGGDSFQDLEAEWYT